MNTSDYDKFCKIEKGDCFFSAIYQDDEFCWYRVDNIENEQIICTYFSVSEFDASLIEEYEYDKRNFNLKISNEDFESKLNLYLQKIQAIKKFIKDNRKPIKAIKKGYIIVNDNFAMYISKIDNNLVYYDLFEASDQGFEFIDYKHSVVEECHVFKLSDYDEKLFKITHSIADQANKMMIDLYEDFIKIKNNYPKLVDMVYYYVSEKEIKTDKNNEVSSSQIHDEGLPF